MELEQRIRQLAFEIHEKNGRLENRELDNWLEAESIILVEKRLPAIIEPEEREITVELEPAIR
jgi:hypothetical protein